MTERQPLRGPLSAYTALGLQPGADRTAVEQAYRRLIKLYHPDRSGGDATRAAEINRAYFELRRLHDTDSPAAPAESHRPPAARRRPGGVRAGSRPARRRHRRPRVWPLVPLALGIWLVIERERLAEEAPRWFNSLAELRPPARATAGSGGARLDSSAIDGPLEEGVIAQAAGQAARLAGGAGEGALASHSRECHRRLRLRPELGQLDRCAAFDDAVMILAEQGPTSDQGSFDAFSASSVTARQMTAASLLSTDYLANERRLNRIRLQVELILLPRLQPLPPAQLADDPVAAGLSESESVPEPP